MPTEPSMTPAWPVCSSLLLIEHRVPSLAPVHGLSLGRAQGTLILPSVRYLERGNVSGCVNERRRCSLRFATKRCGGVPVTTTPGGELDPSLSRTICVDLDGTLVR